MGLHSMCGYAGGFLGPVIMGIVLGVAGAGLRAPGPCHAGRSVGVAAPWPQRLKALSAAVRPGGQIQMEASWASSVPWPGIRRR